MTPQQSNITLQSEVLRWARQVTQPQQGDTFTKEWGIIVNAAAGCNGSNLHGQ